VSQPGGEKPDDLLLGVEASSTAWLVSAAVMSAWILGICAVSMASSFGWLPWLTKDLGLPLALVAFPSVVVVIFAISRTIGKRCGRVEVRRSAIFFYPPDLLFPRLSFEPRRVAWRLIEGFRDDSADYVEIVASGAAFPLPTRDEVTRVKVLALLAERGVPRLDS
jgi:hypothetical protein